MPVAAWSIAKGYGENYSGDYEYMCKMKLTHLSLTFVNSEF